MRYYVRSAYIPSRQRFRRTRNRSLMIFSSCPQAVPAHEQVNLIHHNLSVAFCIFDSELEGTYLFSLIRPTTGMLFTLPRLSNLFSVTKHGWYAITPAIMTLNLTTLSDGFLFDVAASWQLRSTSKIFWLSSSFQNVKMTNTILPPSVAPPSSHSIPIHNSQLNVVVELRSNLTRNWQMMAKVLVFYKSQSHKYSC
jgi:hypothetical protein